jgi:hypothetical protein
MQAIIVTNVDSISNASLEEQWTELYKTADPNFFLSWSWIGNWFNTIKSDYTVYSAYCENQLIGMGIVVSKKASRNFFIKSKQLHLHRTGDETLDQTWIEYNDFLLAKGFEKAARKAIVDKILTEETWDEIVVGASRITAFTPFRLSGLEEKLVWHSHSYQVDLAHLRVTKTDYLKTLSKNTRYQINRSIRSYEKQGSIVLSAASSEKEALQWFDESAPFHIKRWEGTKVGSGFTNPAFVNFHRSLISQTFDLGLVDLLKISAGEHVICYLYNFIQGNEIKFYLSANNYDENDSTFKPGLVSQYFAIKHYLSKGLDIYDFMAGESQYKRSLSSMSSPIYLAVFNKPKLRFSFENKLRILRDCFIQKDDIEYTKNPIRLLLTGGQENTAKSGPQYNKAKIVLCEISAEGELTIINSVDYVPPNNLQADASNIVFKSGSVNNGTLSVVTESEVHKYTVPELILSDSYSLPCFNDLHHVFHHDGKEYVVNTGLDSVVEIINNKDKMHYSTLKNSEETKRQANVDYRQIESTKPHLTHPNFGFVLDNKIWVTRCDTMDAICLQDNALRINVGHNLVHDGVIYKDSIYFTNVDGLVQVFDTDTRELKLTSNLKHFIPELDGWCRGVLPVSTNFVVVGFSKNRRSKKLSSSKHSYGKIILIDILKHKKVWEVNTSDVGLDAIFSILPGDQS